MTNKGNEDAAESRVTTEKADGLTRQLDELEESVITERDDAGVPGRMSERENVQQITPDDQTPA